MPRSKPHRTKPVEQYALVHRSRTEHEEPDAVDTRPSGVLVPVSNKTLKPKRSRQAVRFAEDLDPFENDRMRAELDIKDDDDADQVFGDEVEEEFDNAWIKEMMRTDAPPVPSSSRRAAGGAAAAGDDDDDAEGAAYEDGEYDEDGEYEDGDYEDPDGGDWYGEGDDDDYADADEGAYPMHTERGLLERQFEQEMAEFDAEAHVDEEDPRAHGALDVLDYAPALEEFVKQQAGTTYLEDEAWRYRKLKDQVRHLASDHRVFDTTAEGDYVTVLTGEKAKRMNQYFHADKEALRQLTLEKVRTGEIDTTDVLFNNEPEQLVALRTKAPKADQMDCETVLTTLTNVYNRPTVIAAQTKKVRVGPAALRAAKTAAAEERKKKLAEQKATRKSGEGAAAGDGAGKRPSPAAGPARPTAILSRRELLHLEQQAQQRHQQQQQTSAAAAPEAEEEEEDLFDDLPDEALPSMVELSQRAKDETKEEKQLRRALVKELQRERRLEKKNMRTAYKTAGIAHAEMADRRKVDQKTITMSVVRRA